MGILSGNALKIIAAVTMFIDHMGLMLFPGNLLFRIIGRLAFPIYAFMIAEGCKYTTRKSRYFAMIFGLGVVCQTVYYLFAGSTYLSILFTFSLSILTIYALQGYKAHPGVKTGLLFAGAVAAVYFLNQVFAIDYGFWGSMVPVCASMFHGTDCDRKNVNTGMLALGLAILALEIGSIQFFSLLAIPLLLLYSGKRGKWRMKSFFYIFYPAHLVLLEAIAILTK